MYVLRALPALSPFDSLCDVSVNSAPPWFPGIGFSHASYGVCLERVVKKSTKTAATQGTQSLPQGDPNLFYATALVVNRTHGSQAAPHAQPGGRVKSEYTCRVPENEFSPLHPPRWGIQKENSPASPQYSLRSPSLCGLVSDPRPSRFVNPPVRPANRRYPAGPQAVSLPGSLEFSSPNGPELSRCDRGERSVSEAAEGAVGWGKWLCGLLDYKVFSDLAITAP